MWNEQFAGQPPAGGLKLQACVECGAEALVGPGECKSFKEKFMKCLYDNHFENALCRNESKEYLECRMERKLMLQEPLEKLGFGDLIGGKSEAKK
ncbi:PREDICTED: cytochrome c oxidase assembly protein COX19 [Rhinopithecus bieti]|uniref:cytochrome c oxidase assembly protein COX19 n=1 Tax=Rhinopithecus bieti TaxID=61621 RepID=UPI00083C1CF8|nr:PREDICTED: cytochrome c oxidase assembly protein COX19 [Rhinopithecus bieti]